jgi:hypothetical protein
MYEPVTAFLIRISSTVENYISSTIYILACLVIFHVMIWIHCGYYPMDTLPLVINEIQG